MDGIDVLVNVVGGVSATNPLDLDPADWRQIMDLNLAQRMADLRGGVPIMQARAAVRSPTLVGRLEDGRGTFAYSVAEVSRRSRFFAVQYAPSGIRCNAVLPSWILTPHAVEG